MSTAYICEPNPIILQDLQEIVESYDTGLQVEPIESLRRLEDIDLRPTEWSFVIVNVNRNTYSEIEFLRQYQEAGGQVICIGSIGPSETPPPDWIVVNPPFTTGSIHSALNLARTERARRTT